MSKGDAAAKKRIDDTVEWWSFNNDSLPGKGGKDVGLGLGSAWWSQGRDLAYRYRDDEGLHDYCMR